MRVGVIKEINMIGVCVSDLSRCLGIVFGLVGWLFLDNKKVIC